MGYHFLLGLNPLDVESAYKFHWIWQNTELFIYQQHRAYKHELYSNSHETEHSLDCKHKGELNIVFSDLLGSGHLSLCLIE